MFTHVVVTLSTFLSQFTEKGVKKIETFEHSVVLLLFLSTAFMKSHSSSLSCIYENIIHVSVL